MTAYQEGREAARSALFPEPPAGYKRGRAEHTAFVDIGLIVCEACGAVVGDPAAHDEWHTGLGRVAQHALRADAMTRPIGSTRLAETGGCPLGSHCWGDSCPSPLHRSASDA